MFDVLGGLPNVTDYHIMWCGLQSVPVSPASFLTAAFQSNLRKLSLDISLENVVNLLTPTTQCSIEELDLVIRLDHFGSPSDHVLIMINHLAPALTRLQSTLRKLSIQTWEPLDLSPLFRTLHCLPLLSDLTLGIPVEAPHLGDPSGVTDFLNRQSATLLSLSLRATQIGGAGLTPDVSVIDEWVRDALADIQLPRLRTLDISSSLFPFSASIVCVRHFAGTLTALELTGCYHTHADVVAILAAFRHRPMEERLESLRLGSVSLTPQLLDLLAGELPALRQLELLARDVTPHDGDFVYASNRAQAEMQMVSGFRANWRSWLMALLAAGLFLQRDGDAQLSSVAVAPVQDIAYVVPISRPVWLAFGEAVFALYPSNTGAFLTCMNTSFLAIRVPPL